jgi:3-hydroxyisobutyrate dehydrogenase
VSERSVGFIGLGKMGGPMAANLARVCERFVCFDAAGTADRAPSGANVEIASSVQDVARRCDSVFLSVPDGKVTLALAQAITSATEVRASTVIDLSTIGPEAAVEAAAKLAAEGITYCDGPVSGGAAGARAATISLMFSGETAVLEAHRALLQAFTGNVFHVGERAGQGQAMKLLNNFLSATALAATSEALAFGEAHGLDLATMVAVLNVSTGRNSASADKFPNRILTGTYDAGFSTAHMSKDVGLFANGAAAAGTAHAVASAVTATWRATEQAMPASDFTEIWKFISGPIAHS